MTPARLLLGAASLAAAGVGVRALWLEPRSLVLREVGVTVPGWPLEGLRVGVISDLHTGAPHVDLERVEQLVELVARARPDVVCLLGDYVDPRVALGTAVAPEPVARRLGTLWAPLGTVAVLGNHDWAEGGERIRSALRAEGIVVLENEAVRLGDRLWVVGMADATLRTPDTERAYRGLPEDAVPLVLSHDPDIFDHLPDRPSLVISGHTHGGQVDIPGVRSWWVPSRYGDRFTGGRIESTPAAKCLYVSRGVGTSRLPVRFRARPEVAVLTITG